MDKAGKKQKIAIFGGTFDPIHNGHIKLAISAQEELKLDKIYFVVAKNPPFKQDRVSLDAESRYLLVSQALEDYHHLIPSRVELEREETSYSHETVREFKELFPYDELFFLLGTDAYADIKSWKEAEYIQNNVRFIVYPRLGQRYESIPGKLDFLDHALIDISSTEIRDILKAPDSDKRTKLEGLVPHTIKDQLYEHYAK